MTGTQPGPPRARARGARSGEIVLDGVGAVAAQGGRGSRRRSPGTAASPDEFSGRGDATKKPTTGNIRRSAEKTRFVRHARSATDPRDDRGRASPTTDEHERPRRTVSHRERRLVRSSGHGLASAVEDDTEDLHGFLPALHVAHADRLARDTVGAAATVVAVATISPPSASFCSRDAMFTASPTTVYSRRPAAADRARDHPAGVHADARRPSRADPRRPIRRRSARTGAPASRSRTAARARRGRPTARARRRPPSRRRPGTCRSCRRARRRPRPSLTRCRPTTEATSRASSRSAIVEKPRMSLNSTVTSTSCGSIAVSGCEARRSASCCGTKLASVLRDAVCSTTAACMRLNSSTRPADAFASRHAAEQLGHLTIDGLLGRAERGGDLLVAEALRHHVEQLAVALGGLAAPGEPLGDRRDRPCCRPRAPRGSRARARRPGRSDPSAGRRARCGRGRAARSRTPRRRGRSAPRPPCRGAARGSRARSRCPRAGSSAAS